MIIYGIDFTSAPKRDKPIVVARCKGEEKTLVLERFLEFTDWPAYEAWLEADSEWIGAFDFPFGLPRRFVERQGWPAEWPGMVRACIALGKERFAETAMRAFMAARTAEDKHRRTDFAAQSHSPLKTKTNPPVGLMFYEGAWRLLRAGIRIPGLHAGASGKIAVEAYPGLAVRRLRERFYKNDKRHSGTANNDARERILQELLTSTTGIFSCSLVLAGKSLRASLLDPSGDWLDAALCATQAHWCWRNQVNWGLPDVIDPCEGWIASA